MVGPPPAADSSLSQDPNPQAEEIASSPKPPASTTTPEESTSNSDPVKTITCTPANDAAPVDDVTQDPSALSQHFLEPNPPPTQENPPPN